MKLVQTKIANNKTEVYFVSTLIKSKLIDKIFS